MKTRKLIQTTLLQPAAFLLLLITGNTRLIAQNTDSTAGTESQAAVVAKPKPVKNTFESIWLIDNQTVMVPVKKSFEMDIMHRFGILKTGYQDFYGLFAPSNISLRFSYVPIDRLLVGVAVTKANMTWEGYAKYAIIKQTKGQYPVSVSYLADVAWDSRPASNFYHGTDALMYFHQLMIARKITPKLSVQVAPSLSHQNVVDGYYKTSGTVGDSSYKATVAGQMKHDHFAIAFSARYKIKPTMSLLLGYDQPLTKHASGNPNPNLSLGIEFTTSSHAFQLFFTNYYYITPQRNNLFNKNNPMSINSFNDITFFKQNFLIGFNITRLWNY